MTKFSDWMIAENLQVFWAAMQRGEFITDAAEQAGTYRKKGARWLVAAGGVRPRRGRDLKGRCLSFTEREEIAMGRAAGESLRELESQGWRVFHDLTASQGNMDHVVVGPGGVFLLDSKRWRGSITVDGDSPVGRRIEGPDVHWQLTSPAHVKGLAVEVSEAIRAGTRATVWVTPVIVVWGEFAQVVGGDTCKFVHGDALARWLKDQPVRIAPGRVEQIAEAVASALAGLDVTRRWSRSVRLQS